MILRVRLVFIPFLIILNSCSPTVKKPLPHNYRHTHLEKYLKEDVKNWRAKENDSIGYPINQNTNLSDFYRWYTNNGLAEISMNNVGNPWGPSPIDVNTHKFEKEVIDFFAPLYGFSKNSYWGFVTDSGTDGNNHGIYFGRKYLLAKNKKKPILYVSNEAHYSIKKLADVQNTELRLIKSLPMGQISIKDFQKKLDPKRPALVVLAVGTTFKGAIDDQTAILNTLKKKGVEHYYIHLDAALFGGYLPFLDKDAKVIVNTDVQGFHSIAVSGHKFFGFDNPLGFFITSKEVFSNLNPFRVEYLNDSVPTISCSRSALASLKFWWKIKSTTYQGFSMQAHTLIENARYLEEKLKSINKKSWRNSFSNTVFFELPRDINLIEKYDLARDNSKDYGELAHVVVMQHVTKEKIDQFIKDWSILLDAQNI